jgi:hypothetical protein
MDALVDDGFIILGGPLDDGEKVLLILTAENRQAIEARLADDPWTPMGVGASQKSSAGKSSWLRKDDAYAKPLHLLVRERRCCVTMLPSQHGRVYDVETRRKRISFDEEEE